MTSSYTTRILPQLDTATAQSATWEETLDLPAFSYFGVANTGMAKHAGGHYKTNTKDIGKLSFDLSNNRLLASLTHRGLVRNAAIVTGLEYSRHEGKDTLRGVTVAKRITGGGPWGLRILPSKEEAFLFHELNPIGVDLIDGLFPRYTALAHELELTMLAFAPTETALRLSPRALIQVFCLRNTGKRTLTGAVAITGAPEKLKDAVHLTADCTEAVLCLDAAWTPEFPQYRYSLRPGESYVLAHAFLLGETPEEIRATAARLKRHTSLQWFQLTREFHSARLGQLAIPDAPLLAESLIRFEELCRMPAIHMQDGVLGGTFIGSDYNGPSNWVNASVSECRINKTNVDHEAGTRFGRGSVRGRTSVAPGETLQIECVFTDAATEHGEGVSQRAVPSAEN